ncbi:alkaline phosphatase [Massilia glaciei]|uniref:Alkaline phosphatase n=1 Tax=Massilia glaciei TaxID=1524097 RepID=A0A2U2HHZ3_9BURK|nr:alkaline phosphatase [Massilia glaciei]PWF45522.1 alkaline phosphatase [Massilia glaciei]
MRLSLLASACLAALLAGCAGAPSASVSGQSARPAKNILFFLADGLGINAMTAARVYAVGEDGELTLDTLPESAFVKTFAGDAQVTDSAAAMSAYMTGVKANFEVLSMSAETRSIVPAADAGGNLFVSRCNNGRPAVTLAELAKARGMGAGIVSTARITDATPAATYAHVCSRYLETDIAAALVPGGAGYNPALGAGLDVIFGGGTEAFVPAAQGGKRSDGRDLLAEMAARGYRLASNTAELNALAPAAGRPAIGLFAKANMRYDALRDPALEPGLGEMTRKAIEILSRNPNGFFLMVEGALIDGAQHNSKARRAFEETVAFDNALKQAIAQMRVLDPGLKNTLIVATADHEHTLQINGYAPRAGKTTPEKPGVLGLSRKVADGSLRLDRDGAPYSTLSFGNGEKRVAGSRAAAPALTDAIVGAPDYQQESTIRMPAGESTHGGTDVYLGALGAGAERFRGTIDNTEVFGLIKAAAGW